MLSSTLEEFDPFDELDRQLGRNLTWIDKPLELNVWPIIPSVPQKYRITMNCTGYSPESIQTELRDNNKTLWINGNEQFKGDTDNISNKTFRKTYTLPDNIDAEKMLSFMTGDDRLVVEFPLKGRHLVKSLIQSLFFLIFFFIK